MTTIVLRRIAVSARGTAAPAIAPGIGRRVGVPHGGEPQVGLGGDHAEHVGQVRVGAAQDGDVDRAAQLPP